MLLALCLLLIAAVVLVLAPLALTVGRWQVHHPRLALGLWFCAFFDGIGSAAAAVAIIILCCIGVAGVSGPIESVVLRMAGWLSLGILGALAAFIGVSAEPLSQSWRTSLNRLTSLEVGREKREDFVLLWLNTEEPIACAMPSKDPKILVSTGLGQMLSPAQLDAVIAHEYEHLQPMARMDGANS